MIIPNEYLSLLKLPESIVMVDGLTIVFFFIDDIFFECLQIFPNII